MGFDGVAVGSGSPMDFLVGWVGAGGDVGGRVAVIPCILAIGEVVEGS